MSTNAQSWARSVCVLVACSGDQTAPLKEMEHAFQPHRGCSFSGFASICVLWAKFGLLVASCSTASSATNARNLYSATRTPMIDSKAVTATICRQPCRELQIESRRCSIFAHDNVHYMLLQGIRILYCVIGSSTNGKPEILTKITT